MPLVDWLFMLGLLGVGLSLLFNVWTRLGAFAGGLMLALMYFAAFPPKNNPIVDDHIVYILVLILIASEKKIIAWSRSAPQL